MLALKLEDKYWRILQHVPLPKLQAAWNAGSTFARIQVAILGMAVVSILWSAGSYCHDHGCKLESSMNGGGVQWAVKNYLDNIADVMSIEMFVFVCGRFFSRFSKIEWSAFMAESPWIKQYKLFAIASYLTSALAVFFAFYNVKSAPVANRPGWASMFHNWLDFIVNQVSARCDVMLQYLRVECHALHSNSPCR